MADLEGDELNILVIDDDDTVRGLIVDILARGEHQTVQASSAEEGLELLPFWTFQIAFIDQRLPGMEGLVLGEYLRKNNPDMTIALVTGADETRLERRSRDLAIRYIQKPFTVNDILSVVDEYVEAARQRGFGGGEANYAPLIASYADEIEVCYAMPSIPGRIEERVVTTVKRSLNDLRSSTRYTERNRVIALAGLLAAKVLGLNLPRLPSGRTMFEEYDDVMQKRGIRTEFSSH